MKIENVAVISLEDYAEYQYLKSKSQKQDVDYSRLKVGSTVMLERTGDHCCGAENVYFNKPFVLAIKQSDVYIVNYDGNLKLQESERNDDVKFNTFIQDDNFIHFHATTNSHITKVIEYYKNEKVKKKA